MATNSNSASDKKTLKTIRMIFGGIILFVILINVIAGLLLYKEFKSREVKPGSNNQEKVRGK